MIKLLFFNVFLGLLSFTSIASSYFPGMPSGPADWKVGESTTYVIKFGRQFKPVGTLLNKVTKNSGNSFWMQQSTNMAGMNYVVDYEIRKSDGKVIQALYNGENQQFPDFTMETVSETQTRITVEAGTFDVTFSKHKHPQINALETWIANSGVPMDGIVKQYSVTQMGIYVTELKSFTP